MRYLKKSIAAAGAVAGAATLVAGAALPASASAQRTAGTRVMSFEQLSGFLAGPPALFRNPRVPLELQGAVDTVGVINLGENGPISHVWTFKGVLTARHGTHGPVRRFTNFQTCRETDVARTSYFLLGDRSTGAFRGIRGHGHATVVFSAIVPRHHGQCDFTARPKPFSAFIGFNAEGPVFLP